MSERTAARHRRRRLGAVVAAFLTASSLSLAGCAVVPSDDVAGPSASPAATASAGYRYEDPAAGFAIQFPAEPEVAPISGSAATRATYSTTIDPFDPDGITYIAGGTSNNATDVTHLELESAIFYMMRSGGSFSDPADLDLDGVPALTSELVLPDGKDATLVVAGEGPLLYQLFVIGGTAAERQQFIDSFERLP